MTLFVAILCKSNVQKSTQHVKSLKIMSTGCKLLFTCVNKTWLAIVYI